MPIVVTVTTNTTLGDLKTRIADELARSDLTTEIGRAISDAIKEASTYRFWFMEVRGLTFNLVPGQDYYGSPDLSAMIEIDDLWLTVNGQRRNLRKANDKDADCLADGTPPIGQPYMWTRYGDYVRFYPVPNQVMTATVDGSWRGLPMENDTAWTYWTTEGERYIRALAKRNLFAEVIMDDDRAQTMDALAKRYREELISQTYDRVATGQMAVNG